ncbi:DUF2332 domain-containing protein [Alteribacter aurantiacus]|uniref:DUF2332 domain-containing protein n=1 Tax=Alteribacter aurantiacus TaxID=254410 RepID=UPI000409F4AE|nr:DUF2332 domain-containing protein [Alteribacter aurantiacus]
MNLSGRFTRFAEEECKGSSSLYEELSRKVANDEELLTVAGQAGAGQPIPNLFFGAVHYLLLKGEDPLLLNDYANGSVAFDRFKEFCTTHRFEIEELLKTKRVQTNEIRRCAYLYPVFCSIWKRTNKPLSMIEIGTSAGLQLHWDRYSYTYGGKDTYGKADSPVKIHSSFTGDPTLLPKSPPVASKVGVDLHVNHMNDEEDYLWLKALIWPEHEERRELFEAASEVMKKDPIRLVEGDGVAMLPQLAKEVSDDSTLVVFHTHVANQIPVDVKKELEKNIRTIGEERDVFHVYNNMWDGLLHMDAIIDGKEETHTIGKTEGHGRWFEWPSEWPTGDGSFASQDVEEPSPPRHRR